MIPGRRAGADQRAGRHARASHLSAAAHRAGITTTEIAGTLFVSPNTLKSHMKSIYRKLDVSSRADAVRQGEARGLI